MHCVLAPCAVFNNREGLKNNKKGEGGDLVVKMSGNEVFSSYLDVKVSAKVRRGFTPWKAWHKQWCEIKRLDSVENGAELILKTTAEGAIINRVVLPRSSTVCRIESRSKNYAFGVFTLGRNQKPLLFLSGSCESDTQKWMSLIRKTLCIASYIPVGSLSFHVSLVDNAHSRAARLTGLFGILSVNSQEVTINDPITSEDIIRWKWHQFHQFHLQAVTHPEDEKTICVFHTSTEFVTGPGQIHFYCKEAPRLLELLVTRGKSKFNPIAASQRLSQSEGDLSKSIGGISGSDDCLRNLSNSDDSGVRVSLSSDDSGCRLKNKTSSMTGLLSKTPGGSEADDEDPVQDTTHTQPNTESRIPRGESGVSLSSGVYEEIPEIFPWTEDGFNISDSSNVYTNSHMVHLYEDPEELSTSFILKCGKSCIPPPLPPRIFSNLGKDCDNQANANISTPVKLTTSYIGDNLMRNAHKYRSNTLPAKDLRRLSQAFTSDSDYMVMTPKNKKKTKNHLVPESLYVPMSPITNIKTKLENYYMVMSGKKC